MNARHLIVIESTIDVTLIPEVLGHTLLVTFLTHGYIDVALFVHKSLTVRAVYMIFVHQQGETGLLAEVTAF